MSDYTFDLESDGLLPEATKLWCSVFNDVANGDVFRYSQENLVGFTTEEVTKNFIEQKAKKLIGHNIADFDIPLLKKLCNLDYTGEVEDTYILSQMADPDKKRHFNCGKSGPHSLANWGCWLGRGKPEHEDWSQFSKAMLHRCTEDVEINELVRLKLSHYVGDFKRSYDLEAAFAKCLVKQKEKGFKVDRELIDKHIVQLNKIIFRIDKKVLPQLPKRLLTVEKKVKGVHSYHKKPFKQNGELNQYISDYADSVGSRFKLQIGGPFSRVHFGDLDLGSADQVKEYLLEAGWVPDQWNYNKETKARTSPKLSKEDPFHGVTGSMGKLVSYRMIYRHRRSQLSGFLKIIRPDGRITADVSGLCPTARLKHKGIVNVPSVGAKFGNQMRSIFIASEGYRIVGCDAASCQLRMLCHYMGDDDYARAVLHGREADGTDIHSVNMRIAGLSSRGEAKTLIYAILFGAGDEKLGAQLGCSLQKARAIRAKFMRALPKLKALVEGLKKAWKKRGYLLGLDGRPIYVRSEHMLLVYLLQSAEAIMMKAATCFADRWITARGLDAGMVAHVHDEMQWEVIESHSQEVGDLLEKSIEKAGEWLQLKVPMAGTSKIGLNWRDTH